MTEQTVTRAGLDARQAEQFLYREAHLLDSRGYEEWLALWSLDACYWIPSNADEIDPTRHTSILYDDYARLQERVHRLTHAAAHAQEPPSRTTHLVTNVLDPEPAPDGPAGDADVRSAFHITDLRRHHLETYTGWARHQLRIEGQAIRLVRKVIYLTRNDEPLPNLTFIL